MAVGPRQLRGLLREVGWAGEDLLLLTQPPVEYWHTALFHARSLANQLMVDVWFPAPGADVWPLGDGRLAAAAPDDAASAWRVLAFGRPMDLDEDMPGDVVVPAALVSAPRPATPQRPAPLAPTPVGIGLADRERELLFAGAPALAAPAPDRSDSATGPAEPDLALPDLAMAEPALAVALPVPLPRSIGTGNAHGISWLPESPVVNHRPIDLYLWTPLAHDQVEAWELPSADMFLLAGQDPLRLADRRRNGYLLRLRVPERAAVDLYEHTNQIPAAVRQRLTESGGTHLLPVAWMSKASVTARYDLDGRSGVAARHDIDGGALAIRFEGAEHGVPGLPNEVAHWPDKGQRAGAPSYLLLREDIAVDRVVHRGFVALFRQKPDLVDGHSLVEVKVRKRKAIDVAATLAELGGLPAVGRLHDFVGVDLLLPEADLAEAVISRIWRQGLNGKPVVERPVGQTLADLLAADAPAAKLAYAAA
ncbi:MAG TPA: hypothetical protein VF163_21120 [Micromonosporaceae bacterium]